MAMLLRQSTASQEILLGRFVDSTDGDTAETALTIGNTDIKIWKEGATTLASKTSGGATHISDGWYSAVLDATDTDTLGKLVVEAKVAGALYVKETYMVLPPMVYDSLVLGTDVFQTDVTQLLGTAWLAPGVAGTPDVNTKLAGGTAWNSGSIGAAAIATGAIDSDALAASAVSAIQAGLALAATALSNATWTAARAGYIDNLNIGGLVAGSSEVTGLTVNTRANLLVPIEIETPDASTQVYKIRLHLYDQQGNMEAPDSTPTVTLTNAAGTDRSSRLSVASNPSTGAYTWDYTATAGDTEEQLVWLFTVVENGLTRVYPATSYVVERTELTFNSSDRATLNAAATAAALTTLSSKVGTPAGVSVSADIAAVKVDSAAILIDTNELQTDWVNNGRLDLLVDAILVDTGTDIPASIGNLPTNAGLATALGTADDALLVQVALVKAKTDLIPASPAAVGDIPTLTQIFTTVMTESYRGADAAGSLAQLSYEIIAHLGESSIVGVTKTTKKLNGSTTAKTYTLNSATTPTSITETS